MKARKGINQVGMLVQLDSIAIRPLSTRCYLRKSERRRNFYISCDSKCRYLQSEPNKTKQGPQSSEIPCLVKRRQINVHDFILLKALVELKYDFGGK